MRIFHGIADFIWLLFILQELFKTWSFWNVFKYYFKRSISFENSNGFARMDIQNQNSWAESGEDYGRAEHEADHVKHLDCGSKSSTFLVS